MGEVTAAIYARVSTEQQTRGNTVASQLALLKDRAETDKVRLEPDHAFVDEGYSGSTLVRPALERLRDAVADSRIDRVYILAPDRLARRYAYQVLLVEEFRRSGAEVVFLRHKGDHQSDDKQDCNHCKERRRLWWIAILKESDSKRCKLRSRAVSR